MTNQEYQDGDKDKAKPHNLSFANTSQLQTYASKKNIYHQSRWGGYLVTKVNAIEVAKKKKDKVKDLSYIKCYTYKQKGHYANKCSQKSKNQ